MKPQRHDERGSAAIFVMLMVVALLVAAGLVIDGGYALAKRRQLTNQAEQAARVGADALSEASLRDGGDPRVNPARARAAIDRYLTGVGAPRPTVAISGDTVKVGLASSQRTVILSVAGITSIPVAATGSARSIDADTAN